ncbi:hypothetical protein GGF31_008012 [Allomyces arbusculus]|nr:hypothetical protein GGF31_008012 [Allomyces arbusculus]
MYHPRPNGPNLNLDAENAISAPSSVRRAPVAPGTAAMKRIHGGLHHAASSPALIKPGMATPRHLDTPTKPRPRSTVEAVTATPMAPTMARAASTPAVMTGRLAPATMRQLFPTAPSAAPTPKAPGLRQPAGPSRMREAMVAPRQTPEVAGLRTCPLLESLHALYPGVRGRPEDEFDAGDGVPFQPAKSQAWVHDDHFACFASADEDLWDLPPAPAYEFAAIAPFDLFPDNGNDGLDFLDRDLVEEAGRLILPDDDDDDADPTHLAVDGVDPPSPGSDPFLVVDVLEGALVFDV